MSFAEGTAVPVERSRAEIERLLTKYGAQAFGTGWQPGKAVITFVARDRRVRFELPLPKPDDPAFRKGRTYWREASEKQQRERYEAELRRRWRCLCLIIKAKLEAVASGLVSFETEFMPHIVLPNGDTVANVVIPAIASAYANNGRLLLGPATEVSDG